VQGVLIQEKARTKAERIGRVIVVEVQRQLSQPAGTFGAHRGARLKFCPIQKPRVNIHQHEKHDVI